MERNSRSIYLFCGVALWFVGMNVAHQVQLSRMPYVGWFRWEYEEEKVVISEVRPDTPAGRANIQVGDTLVQFAGLPITPENQKTWYWEISKKDLVKLDQEVPVVVMRSGASIRTSIMPRGLYEIRLREIILNVLLLVFVGVGVHVMAKRFFQFSSRLFAYCLLTGGAFIFQVSIGYNLLDWFGFLYALGFHACLLLFPLFLHFSLIFPERKKTIERKPNLIKVPYIIYGILILYDVSEVCNSFIFNDGRWVSWFRPLGFGSVPREILRILIICIGIGILVHSYVKTAFPIHRRQLKWLLGGLVIGIVPYLCYSILFLILSSVPWAKQLSIIALSFALLTPFLTARGVVIEEDASNH